MATFILVHGAWHGGWCWERLTPLLTAAGHHVIAPDLPGMGADKRRLGEDPLEEWTSFVAELTVGVEGPVILVGHSRGGLVISQVAELVPRSVTRLVYLTAFLLQPGQSLLDVANRYPEAGAGHAIRPTDDPTRLSLDPEAALPVFFGLCSQQDAQAAGDRLTPEPLVALTKPIMTSAERFGRLPRAYIECSLDKAITLEMQRAMQAVLPCDPVITLDTDHSPFYSDAPALARALLELL